MRSILARADRRVERELYFRRGAECRLCFDALFNFKLCDGKGKRNWIRSLLNVQFKNVNGQEFIEVCNLKSTFKIIDEKLWDSVVYRYHSLQEEEKLIPPNYTAKRWISKEGNLDTVFSPYIAALVFYLQS